MYFGFYSLMANVNVNPNSVVLNVINVKQIFGEIQLKNVLV